MAQFLSSEWLNLARELAEKYQFSAGDESGSIQFTISASPTGDIEYFWRIENGQLVEIALGKLDNSDVTATCSYDDAVQISQGKLDISVAFMQGRLKFGGNMAFIMQLLPLLRDGSYAEWQSELAAQTDFG